MGWEQLKQEFEAEVQKIADVTGLSRDKIVSELEQCDSLGDLMERITEMM